VIKQSRRYRIGDAIAVTQQLGDGTWLATFPGFTATGAAESDAIAAIAAGVEGASKHLRMLAIEVAGSDAESTAVIVRTYRAEPSGDVRGQIVNEATGEILHECGWVLSHKEARRDAEQVAQRKGYRVVKKVSE
jgi:hypothetical protein